jgi:sigma-B regulation protein RsbU (phosphoserine phosphatase)
VTGPAAPAYKTASLIVINPSGNQVRVPVDPMPFSIGRHANNNLVLRDNRASRNHARIMGENGEYFVEDLKSSHGTYVNSVKIHRHKLRNSDRIEFGVPDSYTLIFTFEEVEIQRLLDQFAAGKTAGNLSKLRALVEVARTLRSSLSINDVLAAVVDAALAVTGFDRGFLLLKKDNMLEVTVARNRQGGALSRTAFEVPLETIDRALEHRHDLLTMNFDPKKESFTASGSTTANLELRSVACVPLVNVRTRNSEETCMIPTMNETIGLIYLDAEQAKVDLSTGSGNIELLQTLALEASTVLENARLLEEERAKQRLEEELSIAREIQSSLLPRKLPSTGWFRAAGSSIPSHQVGGDCYDLKQINADCWSVLVTDVSGKGVSSALLASLLQGAFLASAEGADHIEELMARVNHFLNERAEGEKYATAFYCTVNRDGVIRWANAGHCEPYLVRGTGELTTLEATGMPLGMLDSASYEVQEVRLLPGDKVVAYTDGLSEAANLEGKFFETWRMKKIIAEQPDVSCQQLLRRLMSAVESFTEDAVQNDDITAVVIEYQPG